MICNNCGNIFDDGHKFCPNCGMAAEGAKVEPQPQPEKYETEYHEGKRVNKVAYILLAIFLSPLGLHKFYGGRVGLGVLYIILMLFTAGIIPFILGVIEAIIAMCRKSDGDGCIYISKNKFFL